MPFIAEIHVGEHGADVGLNHRISSSNAVRAIVMMIGRMETATPAVGAVTADEYDLVSPSALGFSPDLPCTVQRAQI